MHDKPDRPEQSQYYSKEQYNHISSILSEIDIPKNRILFIHARLKGLKEKTKVLDDSYEAVSKLLLDAFTKEFHPKTILVPTFTYSFTDSGIYHRVFSKSEVGRFSEEVRRKFSRYRTPDPVFNVVDTSDHLVKKDAIDYTNAFGSGTLYDYLDEENAMIINFDLPKPIISTQLHHIEKINDVPYRFDKTFEGIVYNDEGDYHEITYDYFVRDLDIDPKWDREKIRRKLIDDGALQVTEKNGIEVTCVSAQEKREIISEEIKKDPEFLIQKNSEKRDS